MGVIMCNKITIYLFLIVFFFFSNLSFSQTYYPTPLTSTIVGQALKNDLDEFGEWNQISFADGTTQTTAATGGAGNPGGSNTELQYNNSGTFDGISTFTTDGTDLFFTGFLMIGAGTPTETLDVNSDAIRVRLPQTPATAAATGDQGQIIWDTSYVYVCVGTDTWKRAAISTWSAVTGFLLLESGFFLLLENGDKLILENFTPVVEFVLLETDDFMLLESGDKPILELI